MTPHKATHGEIQRLAERCYRVVTFLATRDRVEGRKWVATVSAAVQHGKLGPMRLLARELDHMAEIMLDDRDRGLLAEDLRKALDVDRVAERRRQRDRVAAVVAAGAIRTEHDYRLVRDHVEELEMHGNTGREYETLLHLLEDYEFKS